MPRQTGFAITIKGWIAGSKDMDAQVKTLTAIAAAVKSGDAATVIDMMTIDKDGIEAKSTSRNIEAAPTPSPAKPPEPAKPPGDRGKAAF